MDMPGDHQIPGGRVLRKAGLVVGGGRPFFWLPIAPGADRPHWPVGEKPGWPPPASSSARSKIGLYASVTSSVALVSCAEAARPGRPPARCRWSARRARYRARNSPASAWGRDNGTSQRPHGCSLRDCHERESGRRIEQRCGRPKEVGLPGCPGVAVRAPCATGIVLRAGRFAIDVVADMDDEVGIPVCGGTGDRCERPLGRIVARWNESGALSRHPVSPITAILCGSGSGIGIDLPSIETDAVSGGTVVSRTTFGWLSVG